MLASMTGFVRYNATSEWGTLHWEIRCVNHRYGDAHFRLEARYVFLESALRQALQPIIQRGRCDIILHYTPAPTTPTLNVALTKTLLAQFKLLSSSIDIPTTLNMADLLKLPNMWQVSDELATAEIQWLQATFAQALIQLQQDRQREGQQLAQLLQIRWEAIQQHLQQITDYLPTLLPLLKQRLQALLQPFTNDVSPDRLAQEMVYLAHRLDISEECDRFQTHLSAFQAAVVQGGTIGRRLDFLLQEMQREINTLASKANDKYINSHSLEIKIYLEQLREQVQNLE